MTKIPNYKPFIPRESVENVIKVFESGWIGGDGPRVKEFELKIGKVIKNSRVLAVNCGTSALQLALRAIGVKGGEVITTPMTCFATNAAIVNEGAIPVWVDIDPDTGNINPEKIPAKISDSTRAIMVVHWGGSPCDLKSINDIAGHHGIPVIEDAAQALGSYFDGKPIGTHSDFVAFSTQAIKIINTGDGGLIAMKNADHYERIRALRWYGIDREKRVITKTSWDFPICEVGYKMQMTDIAAAIGLGQLPYLDELIEHKTKIASIYNRALKNSRTLRPQKVLTNAKTNHWIYTVLCESLENRARLFESLDKIDVVGEQAHSRNDEYPVFKKFRGDPLPGVTKFNDTELIIPAGFWVDREMAEKVADVLEKF